LLFDISFDILELFIFGRPAGVTFADFGAESLLATPTDLLESA